MFRKVVKVVILFPFLEDIFILTRLNTYAMGKILTYIITLCP